MYKKFEILLWKCETVPLEMNSTSRWKIKGFLYTSLRRTADAYPKIEPCISVIHKRQPLPSLSCHTPGK